MPGQPFLMVEPSYQGVQGEGHTAPPAPGPNAAGSTNMFIIWLVVLGVLLPSLVLGGLRAGGFQFVFRRR